MSDHVKRLLEEAQQLSTDERAELIERLWDTFPSDTMAIPIPDWHREELDRRLAEHEGEPDSTVSWDDALERLRARQRP